MFRTTFIFPNKVYFHLLSFSISIADLFSTLLMKCSFVFERSISLPRCLQSRLLQIRSMLGKDKRNLSGFMPSRHGLGDTLFIPFPHIDAFWRLCSRRLFENIVTKGEIAQSEQFHLLPQYFPLLVIGYPFNYKDFLVFDKICSKSSAAELSYEGKG